MMTPRTAKLRAERVIMTQEVLPVVVEARTGAEEVGVVVAAVLEVDAAEPVRHTKSVVASAWSSTTSSSRVGWTSTERK